MKRYEKEEVNLTTLIKANEEIIISKEADSQENENYKNPPIPKTYKHVLGEWNEGLVIEKKNEGSQYVWIPVGILASNGTLNGQRFNEKFGRRNYRNNDFFENQYHEKITKKLMLQLHSIKKYGGFYFSRFNISKNKKTGKAQSVQGEKPWTCINYYDAKKIASTIEIGNKMESHLVFGSEYDTVLEWIIKSRAKTYSEIVLDSTDLGNFWNTNNSPRKICETGSREEWYINNIADLAGNVKEWTQESYNDQYYVIRGGNYANEGDICPVFHRAAFYPNFQYDDISFRATLYIE